MLILTDIERAAEYSASLLKLCGLIDVLVTGQMSHGYLGDYGIPLDDPRRNEVHFEVFRVSDNEFFIWDDFFHEFTFVAGKLLREPKFESVPWYVVRIGWEAQTYPSGAS